MTGTQKVRIGHLLFFFEHRAPAKKVEMALSFASKAMGTGGMGIG
jgi:hypothetical protein